MVILGALLALTALACITASPAAAAGGNYVVAGGTAYEQAQVRQALDASSFDWNVVPTQVTIHIARGIPVSYSVPGQTWLDANLLDSGTFSWGVVQMEYAQQVQLTVLDAPMRAELTGLLGAQQWCYDNPTLPSGANACERFAATLAWAYWPSPDNSMRPVTSSDWSASMNPQAFRTLLSQLLGVPEAIDTRAVRDLETQSSATGAQISHPTVSSKRSARG